MVRLLFYVYTTQEEEEKESEEQEEVEEEQAEREEQEESENQDEQEEGGNEEEEVECPVCGDSIDSDETDHPAGPLLVCGHHYHAVCLQYWVKKCASKKAKPICHSCRAPLEEKVEEQEEEQEKEEEEE